MRDHSHISWPILPKLAENVEYDKKIISLFCLFFKLKITKIFMHENFHVFLMVHVYSIAYENKTFTVTENSIKIPNMLKVLVYPLRFLS
jgi:hypothetical protein